MGSPSLAQGAAQLPNNSRWLQELHRPISPSQSLCETQEQAGRCRGRRTFPVSWQKDILSAMNTGGVEEKEAETSGEAGVGLAEPQAAGGYGGHEH